MSAVSEWRRLRMKVLDLLAIVVMLLMGALITGCATSGDSEMPWNVPQPWEGTIGLPGFTPVER